MSEKMMIWQSGGLMGLWSSKISGHLADRNSLPREES